VIAAIGDCRAETLDAEETLDLKKEGLWGRGRNKE